MRIPPRFLIPHRTSVLIDRILRGCMVATVVLGLTLPAWGVSKVRPAHIRHMPKKPVPAWACPPAVAAALATHRSHLKPSLFCFAPVDGRGGHEGVSVGGPAVLSAGEPSGPPAPSGEARGGASHGHHGGHGHGDGGRGEG